MSDAPDCSRLPPDAATRSIALIGLMGVGKSTVGRKLAAQMRLPFADADAEIETAAGMSVSDIFASFGEDHFRDGERRVIARLIDGPRKVIATGGGAFINDETRALLLERAVVVWLDADLATLVQRVARRDHRPLLKDKDPAAVLSALAETRTPFYAQAHLAVRSSRGAADHTAEAIRAALA